MRSARALLVVPVLLATGCDPAFWMHGTVRSGAAALEGADVTMKCGGPDLRLGTTDARGQFDYRSMPGVSPDCRVTISKAGYASRSLRLGDVCTGHFGVNCTEATFSAELSPIR